MRKSAKGRKCNSTQLLFVAKMWKSMLSGNGYLIADSVTIRQCKYYLAVTSQSTRSKLNHGPGAEGKAGRKHKLEAFGAKTWSFWIKSPLKILSLFKHHIILQLQPSIMNFFWLFALLSVCSLTDAWGPPPCSPTTYDLHIDSSLFEAMQLTNEVGLRRQRRAQLQKPRKRPKLILSRKIYAWMLALDNG